jgi:hypothetical protein
MMCALATSDVTALLIKLVSVLLDVGETTIYGQACSNFNYEIYTPCMVAKHQRNVFFLGSVIVGNVTHVLCRPYDVITEKYE